jgi:TolB protein
LRLVFTSPCDTNQDLYPDGGLYVISLNGSDPVVITDEPGNFDPTWSPDGKTITFTSLRNGGRARIYSLNPDVEGPPGEPLPVERLSLQYSYDRQPAWSADGQKIAFVSTQKGPVQIWTMDPDGSNQEMYSRSGDKINTNPQWSIGGEKILFIQVERPGRIPGIVVASYIEDDYIEFRYNLGPAPALEAKYSPDGLWLAFESWPQGQNHDIYMITASGGDLTQLTDWERFDFDPAWRPAVVKP